jgi:hypothetical protein
VHYLDVKANSAGFTVYSHTPCHVDNVGGLNETPVMQFCGFVDIGVNKGEATFADRQKSKIFGLGRWFTFYEHFALPDSNVAPGSDVLQVKPTVTLFLASF